MDRKGFSLLEVIMVLVIMAVVGLMAGPRMLRYIHQWDLENEAMYLQSKIRWTQQQALEHSSYTYRIEFDLMNDSYQIRYLDGSMFYDVGPPVQLKNNIDLVSTTAGDLIFDQFGAPLNGNGIQLNDSNTNSLMVYVTPASGRVTIN